MALIKCPNCNGTVSTKASACPHCGAAATPQLTEAERLQKLADELGSMSAAMTAMENGIEPSSPPPVGASKGEKKRSSYMDAAVWVVLIGILVRLWIFADHAWTNHSKAVEAEKNRQAGERAMQDFEELKANIQESQKAEAVRRLVNPDVREFMKAPGNFVQQPSADSSK
jgi:hypothetical protein